MILRVENVCNCLLGPGHHMVIFCRVVSGGEFNGLAGRYKSLAKQGVKNR